MGRLLKIIKTNWVHLLGFYISTYFAIIIFQLLGLDRYQSDNLTRTMLLSLISIPFLFFTYGLIIITSFYILITLLDIIAFRFTRLKVLTIMFIEWLIIIPPFIYWAFKEEYWLWLVLIASLLITQIVRAKWIKDLKRDANQDVI